MTETREIHGCCPLDCLGTCAWAAEVEDGRVVRVSDSTSKGSQTRQPPEPFDSEGLSGSGGGDSNPRPPGYERGTGGRGFLNILKMLQS